MQFYWGVGMNCDFCGGDWCPDEGGAIIMLEQSPEGYRDEDESYNFCSYKCVKRWIAL